MYVAVSREECNAEMRNLSTALEWTKLYANPYKE